jgi:hypothetical protein
MNPITRSFMVINDSMGELIGGNERIIRSRCAKRYQARFSLILALKLCDLVGGQNSPIKYVGRKF